MPSAARNWRLRLGQADLLPGARVTVSIGISALEAGQSAEAWVRRADQALYEAKRSGRDRVMVATATRVPAWFSSVEEL